MNAQMSAFGVRSLPSVTVVRETMENTAPGMRVPMAVNVTVGRSARRREYLTEREIEKLIKAAGENRWGHRDATAILIAYRHGLRASELVDDIDFHTGKLHVRRAKGGSASVHPIGGRELRALRQLKREAPASVYVFVSERLAPLSVAGYQRMVARAGEAAGFPFLIHSHMLRHSCGYKLANDGQDTAPFSTISVTARSLRPYVTPHWRPIDSKTSGKTEDKGRRACAAGA
jgi:integrase